MKAMTALLSSAEQVLPRGFTAGSGSRADPTQAAAPPPEPATGDLEPTIYRFIVRNSLRQQIFLLVLTLASFPFLYYSLKLPKTIVNKAIGGHHFPQEFLGIQFDQVPYLML